MGLTVPSTNLKQLGSGAPLAVTVSTQVSVAMKVINTVNDLIGDHAENWNRFSEPMDHVTIYPWE